VSFENSYILNITSIIKKIQQVWPKYVGPSPATTAAGQEAHHQPQSILLHRFLVHFFEANGSQKCGETDNSTRISLGSGNSQRNRLDNVRPVLPCSSAFAK